MWCVFFYIFCLWILTVLYLFPYIVDKSTFLQMWTFPCVSLFRYYAFDDVFVREVLGKKLSKGTKKDLDDISAKTGVTLKSCRRQVNTCSVLLLSGLKTGSAQYCSYVDTFQSRNIDQVIALVSNSPCCSCSRFAFCEYKMSWFSVFSFSLTTSNVFSK